MNFVEGTGLGRVGMSGGKGGSEGVCAGTAEAIAQNPKPGNPLVALQSGDGDEGFRRARW